MKLIPGYAFTLCTALTSVTFSNSVNSIGDYAFDNCTGLTSLTIPNSVTTIGNAAFLGCSGLTTVTIPNSVNSIGIWAFYGCNKLTSLTIPNSVVSIGEWAFKNCTALTSVVFNAENCTKMGSGSSPVFQDCSNLTSIIIGENVKSIPRNAFYECRALTSVTIPNSVTSIGDYAFCACLRLTSVTIPGSVTSIGESAFRFCNNMMSFKSLNTTPPTLPSEDVFGNIPTECTLFVPKASIEAYKVATGWTYFNKVYAIEDGMVETIGSEASKVTVEGGAIRVEGAEGAVAEVYSLSGALLYRGTDSTIALPRGIYVVKVAGTTTKVIL